MCEMKRGTICWFKISEKEPGFSGDKVLVTDGTTVFPAVWYADTVELDGREERVRFFIEIDEEGEDNNGAIWAQDYLWWCYLPEAVK